MAAPAISKLFLSRACVKLIARDLRGSIFKTTSCNISSIADDFHKVMSKVPQAVVVVTTAECKENAWYKRGVTCSSFTSVSLRPPIISFCIKRPSRMHDMLLRSQYFAVHVLGQDQVGYGVMFSKNNESKDQFELISHELGDKGVPIIHGSLAIMQCQFHSVHTVGDHYVWYGDVRKVTSPNHYLQPLLYYTRSYRSVGDEIFLKAFEEATLPFEEWTHEAHIRMAWNYIRQFGKEDSIPLIRNGIQKYNEQNLDKIKVGYHETMTLFFASVIDEAIRKCQQADVTFEEFISQNQHLVDKNLVLRYYSREQIMSDEARKRFVTPDKEALP